MTMWQKILLGFGVVLWLIVGLSLCGIPLIVGFLSPRMRKKYPVVPTVFLWLFLASVVKTIYLVWLYHLMPYRTAAIDRAMHGLPYRWEMSGAAEAQIRDSIKTIDGTLDPFSGDELLEIDRVKYSVGPDMKDDKLVIIYDPSNGTLSPGDIVVSP